MTRNRNLFGQCFGNPNPYNLSKKYGSTPPICTAVRLLSFEERETLQYASHLYCSTPPICTAVCPPFVRQYFRKNTGGWGHRNVSDNFCVLNNRATQGSALNSNGARWRANPFRRTALITSLSSPSLTLLAAIRRKEMEGKSKRLSIFRTAFF